MCLALCKMILISRMPLIDNFLELTAELEAASMEGARLPSTALFDIKSALKR